MSLTRQEIFDKVLERLFDGRGPAVNSFNNKCLYLTPDGNKCAIGIFIPDGHVAQSSTREAVVLLLRDYPELGEIVNIEENSSFIRSLQGIHDAVLIYWNGNMPNKGMVRALRHLVKRYELSATLLDEFERRYKS